ncbi:MAG: hypothetical protein RIG82_09025 [Phycisphaeraceae bacterium]
MKLCIFRHTWGVTEPLETCFARYKAKGYDGIECPSAEKLPHGVNTRQLRDLLDEVSFDCITPTFTAGDTVADHVQSFREELDRVMPLRPIKIGCHSGLDRFPIKDAITMYQEFVKIESDLGITVGHETHRSRVFYNPWTTRTVLEAVPEIRLLCDYSHWVCVCERIPEEPEIFDLCSDRCVHVHARIGYAEGPQVTDPDAPEFATERAAHETWWMQVWDKQRANGESFTTLTPEFGPPPYLHTLPRTQEPVGDLEDICDRQAQNIRSLFMNWSREE